jgi:hypothetical protein
MLVFDRGFSSKTVKDASTHTQVASVIFTVQNIFILVIFEVVIGTTTHSIPQGGSRNSLVDTLGLTLVSIQSVGGVTSGVGGQDVAVGLALSQEVSGSISDHT